MLFLNLFFSVAHKYTVEKSSRERWVYIEGIVVSICLASIFLVAMIVFFCYYRAQKSSGQPRCEISKSSSRGTNSLEYVKKKKKEWTFCAFKIGLATHMP